VGGLAPALPRLLAFAIDWVVIAAWGGAIFALVWWSSDGSPSAPANPWQGQAIGFLSMTLPVALYFSLCEASARQGTLGKHMLGLRVCQRNGERAPWKQTFLRAVGKLFPWELGHLLAQQAFFAGEDGLSTWVLVPGLLSFALPAWWVASLLVQGRTPYDRWSRTMVHRVKG